MTHQEIAIAASAESIDDEAEVARVTEALDDLSERQHEVIAVAVEKQFAPGYVACIAGKLGLTNNTASVYLAEMRKALSLDRDRGEAWRNNVLTHAWHRYQARNGSEHRSEQYKESLRAATSRIDTLPALQMRVLEGMCKLRFAAGSMQIVAEQLDVTADTVGRHLIVVSSKLLPAGISKNQGRRLMIDAWHAYHASRASEALPPVEGLSAGANGKVHAGADAPALTGDDATASPPGHSGNGQAPIGDVPEPAPAYAVDAHRLEAPARRFLPPVTLALSESESAKFINARALCTVTQGGKPSVDFEKSIDELKRQGYRPRNIVTIASEDGEVEVMQIILVKLA